MLLAWKGGDLEDTALSDSDSDGEDGNDDNREPVARYSTEDEYKEYVPQSHTFANTPLRPMGPDIWGNYRSTMQNMALQSSSSVTLD
jgi:hypothetical protein